MPTEGFTDMFMPIAGSKTSPSGCDEIKDRSFYRTQKFKVLTKVFWLDWYQNSLFDRVLNDRRVDVPLEEAPAFVPIMHIIITWYTVGGQY